MKYLVVIALALCIIVVLESTVVNGQDVKGNGGVGATVGAGGSGGAGGNIRTYKGKWTGDEWRGEDNLGNKIYRRRVKGRTGKYRCEDFSGSSSFATSDGKSDSWSNECFD